MSEEIPQSEELEFSQGEYRLPFPDDTEVLEIQKDIESHQDPYKGAIDFLVSIGTSVLAAREGTVIAVVDEYDKHGPTKEFAEYLNYVQIVHDDGEVSDYCHLAKGSAQAAKIKVGDRVEEAQLLGKVGRSGWMDADHLHFLVSRPDPDSGHGFKGLKPRFKGELKIKKAE